VNIFLPICFKEAVFVVIQVPTAGVAAELTWIK
jgi:hypothetical protein